MSGRINFIGYGGRQNEKFPRKNYSTYKPSPLLSDSNPNPLIYDKNDFPSLSASSEQASSDPEVKVLKYSDKLKSSSQNQSHHHYPASPQGRHSSNFASNKVNKDFFSNNPSLSRLKDTGKVNANSAAGYQQPRQLPSPAYGNHYSNQALNEQNAKFLNSNSNKTSARCLSSNMFIKSNLEGASNKEINSKLVHHKSGIKNKEEKIIQSAQQNVTQSFNNASNKIYALSSSNNMLSKSSLESPSNKQIKCDLIFDKTQAKNVGEKADMQGKTTKKKKRKSKVKRQAAMQTGKITVLTPEVHSKILNHGNAQSTKNVESILTDINDEEEYPELGKSFTPSYQKENALSKENAPVSTLKKEKISDVTTEAQLAAKKDCILYKETAISEKKGKSDCKAIHDPITVAFLDMLVIKRSKTKVKEYKEDISEPTNTIVPKAKSKKGLCHAPNLLDSSCPAIKRGKERENPKPKKPSQLKKIILLDRKLRREQILQLKSNSNEENVLSGNTSDQCDCTHTTDSCIDSAIKETVVADDLCNENILDGSLNFETEESDDECQGFSLLSNENSASASCDENRDTKEICDAKPSVALSTQEILNSNKAAIESTSVSIEKHLNVIESNDSLLKSLSGDTGSVETCEKEIAAKILLHTRNFRQYCNHLISKDIDDAVHALLDDLARFQDRLHQKDPVKARIKRRMIYGVKEVKKHIKLKRLKCIIIATDIENVETEGGLNDILNDIKSLAADHNILCVFALGRKGLGKVCRKPVPVSCIGVFNSDGSEANYKKIVELLTQSKKDYAEILDSLSSKLTKEEADILIKAKKEAPETLHDIRSNILREYFLLSQSDGSKQEETNCGITDSSDSE